MNDEQTTPTGGLSLEYQRYDKQRCFVGHSLDAPWRQDLVTTCDEVMPAFGLQPWYAADHFSPTQSLREKVVELIANTRYGIYDLSYWRADDKSEWHMPRNVFIELGVAIALNRPMLLLRHSTNSANHLSLPECLESISEHILEFSGAASLRRVLKERLAQWADTPPEQDWWNRYCIFGNRVCEYREEHPHLRQWGQQTIRCHISDGKDTDRPDFRELVEDVLSRFEDVSFDYLDKLRPGKGYDFLLCTHCQTVRSTPFAIYRITPHTPPETFIAIGMSLALETQFSHTIPKILLTANVHDIPSLLTGYEVVVAQNDFERKTYLRKFTPQVIQLARKTTWKPRPLPFIEVMPRPAEKSASENEQGAEPESEIYIDTIGKYGVIEEIGRGIITIIYRVRDTESKQVYAMKVLLPQYESAGDELLTRFQREAQILMNLKDSHIVRVVEYGIWNNKHCIVMEYVQGHNLMHHIRNYGPMEPLKALNYTNQVAEGLDTTYKLGVVHRDITPRNILIDNKDEVKISDFGLAHSSNFITLTEDNIFMGTAYYIPPEQAESGRSADTRSDLYSLAVILFEMLAGRPPFESETVVDIIIKHMNDKVPSICRLRPELPADIDTFLQKALAKAPADRYQTPREFIAALDELTATIKAPPGQAAYSDNTQPDELAEMSQATSTQIASGIDAASLVGKSLGQYRIVEHIGTGGMAVVFKAYQPALDRYVAVKVLPARLATDGNYYERFQQSANLVARLQHANIVPVYESDEQNGIHFIVMEYIDGGTLKDRLKSSIPAASSIDFMIQAAEGLRYIHSQGIVHQDVGPTNMLVRKDGHLLLSGFSLTKYVEAAYNITRPGLGVGTPHYLSPEQGTGQPVDSRSDIYSLGIVLFQMLTGTVPFNADNPLSIIVKHLNEPLPVEKLREVDPGGRLVSVVVKMTAKLPVDRYQSMQEVIDALKNVLVCPYCGSEIRLGDNFCLNCGNRLHPATSQSRQPSVGDITIPAPDDWLAPPANPSYDPGYPNAPASPDNSAWYPIDDAPTITVAPPSVTYNSDADEEPAASPAQRLLEDTNYTGQTVGAYRIESEIGRGGLGRVYLAQHLENAHSAAIKIFYAHLSEKQKRNLASQEMLLRYSLKHPYILSVLEVSLQQQPQYMISEYAAGGTLHDRMLSWQPRLLPWQEATTILSQVGEALASMHQQGIIHRDIKPANILFNEQGEVRLADFDLAVVLDTGATTKKVDRTGSPPYMAPEQFEGNASRYSDQYALGCIAYELFTGSKVFSADNYAAIQFKHTFEQPLAPGQLNPDLPAHIEQAILKALAKAPTERHPDVTSFIAALHGS